MQPITLGVTGVGSLGFHHARLMRQLPGVSLSGIYDIDSERAAQVAHQLGTRASASLEELLDASDAVTVAVPTSAHFDIGVRAIEHGCDVLIEKPICATTQEADELIRRALRNDRLIQVGHIERFNGAVRACERFLDDPLFVESHRLAPFARRGTDVPVVLDLMIHDIDLILSLLRRRVADVRAVGVPVVGPSVDIANARIEFEGGAVANITASRVSAQRQRKIRFFQPSGYLSMDLGKGSGEYYRRREGTIPRAAHRLSDVVEHVSLRGDGQEPLRLELAAFASAVRRDAPVPVTAEEGRMALAIALEIVERIEGHRDHVFDSNSARTKTAWIA